MHNELVSRANVDVIEQDGRRIYLVGTAHVSQSSVELAESVIRETTPDAVAVELCEPRFKTLRDPERWKNTDIVEIIKEGKVFLLLAQLILATFQRKLGKELQVKPGAEMLKAVTVAEEMNIPVILADRDVKVTLRRTWAALSRLQKLKLLVQLPAKAILNEKIDPQEIERLKESDALDAAMLELSKAFPGVQKALIDERDQYLAAKIRAAKGEKIVAIVGAGHVPGIKRYLDQPIDLATLEAMPPRGRTGRIILWCLSLLILASLVYGTTSSGVEHGLEMAKSWILLTGGSAALGASLALSHPLTILMAFISGPLTTLAPITRPGWFAGLTEAILRKPKVADLECILDDMSSFRGVWSNRFSRILLIVVFTNILGRVGMLLAIGKMASFISLKSTGGI
jgi:pheromone shutdown-related protein TraB